MCDPDEVCSGSADDPIAWRDHIRFYAAIFTRSAAGKISHTLLSISINKKFKPVVFGSAGGDDVLGDGGAADGLEPRPGVSGGKLEDVRLIARRVCIRIAHQGIKFSGTDIVTTLSVVSPTI